MFILLVNNSRELIASCHVHDFSNFGICCVLHNKCVLIEEEPSLKEQDQQVRYRMLISARITL